VVVVAVGVVRAALTAAVAAVLLTAAAGCGERSEPIEATVPAGTLTVQGASEAPTVLRSQPRRIAAVGPTPSGILRALGAGRLLVGDNLDILNGPPLVSALRRLRPDLIAGSTENDSADLDRARRTTGAPIYVAPDGSIRQVERAIDDLGLLSGYGARGRELVAEIQGQQQRVAAKLAHTPRVRVFVDTGFFSTVGDRSLLGDIVRAAGGANVAGANPETGPFDLSELALRKPQVYLATSDSGTTLAALKRNPKTRRLPAVQNGRFAIVPAQLVQAGPRIGTGLVTVARLLHPNAFR
jgi:iron complex transport system substrate-binding protein